MFDFFFPVLLDVWYWSVPLNLCAWYEEVSIHHVMSKGTISLLELSTLSLKSPSRFILYAI